MGLLIHKANEPLWGILPELQALVAPRKKKIFAFCFLGSDLFAQRFNWPFDKNGQIFFGRLGLVLGRFSKSCNGRILIFWNPFPFTFL